jgi:hypothetical protein
MNWTDAWLCKSATNWTVESFTKRFGREAKRNSFLKLLSTELKSWSMSPSSISRNCIYSFTFLRNVWEFRLSSIQSWKNCAILVTAIFEAREWRFLFHFICSRISCDPNTFRFFEFSRFESLSISAITKSVNLISTAFNSFTLLLWKSFAQSVLLPVVVDIMNDRFVLDFSSDQELLNRTIPHLSRCWGRNVDENNSIKIQASSLSQEIREPLRILLLSLVSIYIYT